MARPSNNTIPPLPLAVISAMKPVILIREEGYDPQIATTPTGDYLISWETERASFSTLFTENGCSLMATTPDGEVLSADKSIEEMRAASELRDLG